MVVEEAWGPSMPKLEPEPEDAAGFTDAPCFRRKGLLEPKDCPLEDMIKLNWRTRCSRQERELYHSRVKPHDRRGAGVWIRPWASRR